VGFANDLIATSHEEDRAFVAMHDHTICGWLRRKKTLSGQKQAQ